MSHPIEKNNIFPKLRIIFLDEFFFVSYTVDINTPNMEEARCITTKNSSTQ